MYAHMKHHGIWILVFAYTAVCKVTYMQIIKNNNFGISKVNVVIKIYKVYKKNRQHVFNIHEYSLLKISIRRLVYAPDFV